MGEEHQDNDKITASELRNGPLAERGCTDTLCCILFTAFVVVSTCISIYGFKNGDPRNVYIPVDSDARACGTGKNAGYPYIYFAAPNKDYLWRTTCVKTCPTKDSSELDCSVNSKVTSCKGVSGKGTLYQVESDIRLRALASIDYAKDTVIYPTKPVFKTVCFPVSAQIQKAVMGQLNVDSMSEVSNDFSMTWEIMLASVFIALVLGFVFMVLIRYCAGLITWLFIISFLLLLVAGTGIAAANYFGYHVNFSDKSFTEKAQGDNDTDYKNYYLAALILLTIVTLLAFCAVFCLCNKIRLSIAIMETSSIFVGDNPMSVLMPLLNVVAIGLWLAFWVGSLTYLYSTGERKIFEKQYPYGSFKHSESVNQYFYFQAFALLWVTAFLMATLDFVIVSACSLWYFQYGAEEKPYNPIRTSVYRLFRFHLGTVAFGSLVLAIVWAIQLVFEYLCAQSKQAAQENKVIEVLVKCCRCYLACFERFIRYLNKNAYCLTAMTGTSFCGSARDAFSLILRNPIRFGVVSSIGELFTAVGRIFLCLTTAMIGYLIIKNSDRYEEVSSPIPSTLVFGIIGLTVGGNFMTVYGIVADAVLLIFTMEEEIEKYHGAAMKVNRCPEPLEDFVKQHA